MRRLVIVVDERHEIDVGERAQRAKQVISPDAVAAIRARTAGDA